MTDTNRHFIPIVIALLAVMPLLADAGALPQYERTRVLDEGRPISDAQLTDQHGGAFSLSELEGRVAFVFFGFTNCPDVCPMTMGKFRQLQDAGTLDAEDVAFVLISVDGERDTPSAMKEFLDNFSPDFVGLTAEPVKVKKIAKEFRASFFKGSSEKDGSYSIAHSPQVFVLDAEGQLRAEMYDPPVDAMEGLARALLDSASQVDSGG